MTPENILGNELAPKEVEYLLLRACGKQVKEIAAECGVLLNTVKFSLSHINRKLGTSDKLGSIIAGLDQGIISLKSLVPYYSDKFSPTRKDLTPEEYAQLQVLLREPQNKTAKRNYELRTNFEPICSKLGVNDIESAYVMARIAQAARVDLAEKGSEEDRRKVENFKLEESMDTLSSEFLLLEHPTPMRLRKANEILDNGGIALILEQQAPSRRSPDPGKLIFAVAKSRDELIYQLLQICMEDFKDELVDLGVLIKCSSSGFQWSFNHITYNVSIRTREEILQGPVDESGS